MKKCIYREQNISHYANSLWLNISVNFWVQDKSWAKDVLESTEFCYLLQGSHTAQAVTNKVYSSQRAVFSSVPVLSCQLLNSHNCCPEFTLPSTGINAGLLQWIPAARAVVPVGWGTWSSGQFGRLSWKREPTVAQAFALPRKTGICPRKC